MPVSFFSGRSPPSFFSSVMLCRAISLASSRCPALCTHTACLPSSVYGLSNSPSMNFTRRIRPQARRITSSFIRPELTSRASPSCHSRCG